MNKFNLQDRLIDFATDIVELVRDLPKDGVSRYFGMQLLRSGSSPALHYSEAMSAESRRDFIHKMKVGLKELRETHTNLRILSRISIVNTLALQDETNQLISIFVASVKTTQANMRTK